MFLTRRKEIFHQDSDIMTQKLTENDNALTQKLSENEHFETQKGEIADDVPAEKVANLNMISACTHIGGDSMRTAAVFLAALITSTTDASSTACDAWASIVILFTITIMIVPLVKEIYLA
jgi:Co/Zn/Cd efflux system component